MHSKLQGNVVHHGVELLLLVSMLFLLAIPKSLLILKEFLYTLYISGNSRWRCSRSMLYKARNHLCLHFVGHLSDEIRT